MNEITMTKRQAEQLEEHVAWHMSLCHAELMGDEVPEYWSSFDPYCGCETCETREYLMATFAWLKENGIVDIYVQDNIKDESETLF